MKKRRSWIIILLVVLAVLLLAGAAAWLLLGKEEPAPLAELRAVVFKTGKSDCILLYTGDEAMLIDTADSNDGDDILEALAGRGIDRLDRIILTHNDKDHIGGADKIIKGIPVGEVMQSAYSTDSKQYDQLDAAAERAGITLDRVTEETSFSLGDARVNIFPAQQIAYENENNYSLVVEVLHGENRLLFAGDAESERISELLGDGIGKCDFLKVPHHGKACGMSEKLFLATQPKWAVITCSKKEGAEQEVVTTLENLGAQVLLTKDGTVEAVSDGITLAVTQESEDQPA